MKHFPVTRLFQTLVVVLLPATLLLVAGSQLRGQDNSAPQGAPLVKGYDADSIVNRARDYVRFLASDELQGRRTSEPGNVQAAEFIAAKFRAFGLETLAGGKGYFHYFDYTAGVEAGAKNSLQIGEPSSPARVARLNVDFTPTAFSSSGTISAPLVFAGYGITASDVKYDDYEGIDAVGKIVVVMRYSPDGTSPHGDFSANASFPMKLLNAREHGAVGIIFINQPNDSAVLMPMRLDRNFTDAGLPVHFALSTLFNSVSDPSGRSLADVQRAIDSTRRSASFPMGNYSAQMTTDVLLKKASVPNIVGVIRGTDPKLRNEYIVIGAHMDHLGNGGEGSLHGGHDPAIHHGADDNASGTAGVLLIAEHLASRRDMRRSVILVAFNGEEEGLLGSAALVSDPPIALGLIVAMVNMDMIGRLDSNKVIVQGTGTSPWWEKLVNDRNADRFALKQVKDGFGPSDHSSFYGQGIPVLFLFTGLHTDYHRPSDTWEKINYPGLAAVAGFVDELVHDIDRHNDRPPFTKTASSASTGSTGFRVYVGTIPDYAYEGKGLRLSGVAEGGPADKGGIQGGDIIVRFGPHSINNIYDYTYALGQLSPKQIVEVEYLRGNKTITTKVELGTR